MQSALILTLLLLTACDVTHETKTVSGEDSTPPSFSETTSSPAAKCQADWLEVADGARYRTTACDANGSYDLHVVELDPKKWNIDAVNGPRRSIREASSHPFVFAINANFFDANDRALGVVITNGKSTNPKHDVSWQSVFSVRNDGSVMINRQGDFALDANVHAAAQAGPRLTVGSGPNQVAEGKPSLRSGVCIANGIPRFFVTPQDRFMTVHDVAAITNKPEASGGLGCDDAMLFDGGPSAQMLLLTDKKKIEIEGDVVPAYVIASPSSSR